jgi:hypothetical protein
MVWVPKELPHESDLGFSAISKGSTDECMPKRKRDAQHQARRSASRDDQISKI